MVQEMSMSITTPNQHQLVTNPLLIAHHHVQHDAQDVGGGAASSAPSLKKFAGAGAAVKYMECLKNHAAAIGGSATDGCGEFMAGGQQGTLEALKCSACNCHRNFHRKIHMQMQMPQHNGGGGVLRMKSVYEAVGRRQTAGDEGEGRKRFRTKFSQEQKEKMVRFAERAEWKIQKTDDAELRSFCEEIGVTRKVLKVWMHNNKYNFANKTTILPIN